MYWAVENIRQTGGGFVNKIIAGPAPQFLIMIEVFKTNVQTHTQAAELLGHIHRNFTGYKANFDLDDCDRILRVKADPGPVQAYQLVELLEAAGFEVSVLPDELPASLDSL